MSLPVTRPAGRALVVGHPASRRQPLEMLRQMGFTCAEADDPYAAMGELCRSPSEYKALVLSLAGVYTEELEMIAAIKLRHPSVEVWLTDTGGRQAALAEAMRLGADGVADEDGFHRIAMSPTAPPPEGRTRGATAAALLAMELSQLAGQTTATTTTTTTTTRRATVAPASTECGAASAIGSGAPPEDGSSPQRDVGHRESTHSDPDPEESAAGDPVLTADELRALLHEPASPTHASRSEP